MPRFEFKSENVKKNPFDFPKLRLKKNEIARVVLLEDPEGEYTHDLNKPKMVNGVPEIETKNRRDGSTYEEYRWDFITRAICLGDFGVLEEKGSDPARCPFCAAASGSDRFRAPKRRFAMHVLKYGTKAGKSDLATPFQVQPVIWAYTDKVFEKLFGIKEEWGDLRKRDLILKCENEIYQNYEITVANKAAWLEDADRKKIAATAFKENRADNLKVFCGTEVDEAKAKSLIEQVNDAFNLAEGAESQSELDASITESLESGLDDLLSDEKEEAAEVGSFDDLLGDDSDEDTSLADSVDTSDDDETASDDELDNLLSDLVD
jgi:hypothetical protein